MNEHAPRRTTLIHAASFGEADVGANPTAGLVRVRRGIYVAEADWPSTEREARHFVRMQAVQAGMSSRPVFSHVSAAVLWGVPVVGALEQVHLMAAGRIGRRSRRGTIWHNHRLEDADVTDLHGFLVTSLARTLFDLASSMPHASGVAAIDAGTRSAFRSGLGSAVAGVPKAELVESFAARGSVRGIRQAMTCASFSDARSGSAGESVSRWNMHVLGFPSPELQVPFEREDGGFDVVDFDWPEWGRFGEFDGFGKYVREEYTGGRSIQEIVWDEKQREDRIRRHRRYSSRWTWPVALNPVRLERRLLADGLRRVR
jgi:hypothetical protein